MGKITSTHHFCVSFWMALKKWCYTVEKSMLASPPNNVLLCLWNYYLALKRWLLQPQQVKHQWMHLRWSAFRGTARFVFSKLVHGAAGAYLSAGQRWMSRLRTMEAVCHLGKKTTGYKSCRRAGKSRQHSSERSTSDHVKPPELKKRPQGRASISDIN